MNDIGLNYPNCQATSVAQESEKINIEIRYSLAGAAQRKDKPIVLVL